MLACIEYLGVSQECPHAVNLGLPLDPYFFLPREEGLGTRLEPTCLQAILLAN